MIVTMNGIFQLPGSTQTVALPDSTGAMLGFKRVGDEAGVSLNTPFSSTSPTLGKRKASTSGPTTPECTRYNQLIAAGDAAAATAAYAACARSKGIDEGAACKGLEARIRQYGPLDPNPAVRKVLLEKCEAFRKMQGAIAADGPSETGPAPSSDGPGLDMKTKVAIGAAALLAVVIVAKKLKKK
jgi:hypothetical protein